ncbi:MAG: pyrimidine-nucleoside phosphorylase [Clostridia bacterium]|nr:pyrimidine-nucleoside phosphorylase [Clostridia bacterium]
MRIIDIIEKKRDKQELTKQEIEYFVTEYTKGNVKDYQASALVMAIFLNGMTDQETTNLTIAMAHSGETLDLSTLNETIVDKHSTGGVGDKVSLILLPLVSSMGVPVAKMSGRGLGFTGGTVDKLEAIPGYKTGIEMEQFIQNVKQIGISMISQTLNLAPADKKLYALRDSISCVESIPLIASSIMSKKIASGAQKIVLDVTVGKGAFMKDIDQARKLSKTMIEIGKLAKRETVCILTNMNEPLGYSIGNSLEVIEAVNFLKGDMPDDLKEVVLELGAYMLKLADKGENLENNKKRLLENIENNKAYEKFIELIENQGGDSSFIENFEKLPKAKYIEPIYSKNTGNIQEINSKEVGKLAGVLGAGREKKEDNIDHSVGIILAKKVADKVIKGDILAYIHANNEIKLKEAKIKLQEIIKISEQAVTKEQTILEIIK